jgi:hypothetical protein
MLGILARETKVGGRRYGGRWKQVMTKFLTISVATAVLAIFNAAPAQVFTPPSPNGYSSSPSPSPGYDWREQRGDTDWRNHTWREQQFDQDWRNQGWRRQRANEDWRQREEYQRLRAPNNATDRGYGTGPAESAENKKTAKEECGTLTSGTANSLEAASSAGTLNPCPSVPTKPAEPAKPPENGAVPRP